MSCWFSFWQRVTTGVQVSDSFCRLHTGQIQDNMDEADVMRQMQAGTQGRGV